MGFPMKPKKSQLSISDLTEIFNPESLTLIDTSHQDTCLTALRRDSNILVIEFDINGNSRIKEIKRTELLTLARIAAEEADIRAVECLGMKPVLRCKTGLNGNRQAFRGVHMRDLRMLDAAFTASNEPSIIVRKQAILFNADPIRAVIFRHSCFAFVPQSASGLMSSIRITMKQKLIENDNFPFEFCAIDAILSSLYNCLNESLNQMTPRIYKALSQLVNTNMNSGQLETLRNMKNSVNEFHLQVCGIRRAIMDILDNDDDMRLLYISKLYDKPELLETLAELEAEEAETLLESYLLDIHTTRTKVEMLQNQIQNTESLVMLKLDSTRNQLLTVDVLFALFSMFMSLGMLVTGYFGMNLKSGLEDVKHLFWWVLLATAIISSVVTLSVLLYFKRHGLILI